MSEMLPILSTKAPAPEFTQADAASFLKVLMEAMPAPLPHVFTAEDAARFLRLGSRYNGTLAHYREKGWLKGRRVGKRVVYLRKDLEELLELCILNDNAGN